jgi:hypothetical protein
MMNLDDESLHPENPENIKKVIEYYNFWYLIECEHCQTLFLVESSVDGQLTAKKESLNHSVFCPRCGTENKKPLSTTRLKLRFSRFARNNELDLYTTQMTKIWRLPKEAEEKAELLRDTYRAEKNFRKKKGDKNA